MVLSRVKQSNCSEGKWAAFRQRQVNLNFWTSGPRPGSYSVSSNTLCKTQWWIWERRKKGKRALCKIAYLRL